MIFRRLADLVLLVHVAFVGFVVLGGVLVARRPRVAWLHVPAVAWGALIEFAGWVCPLTVLENALRSRGGELGYAGDCFGHYVAALIYPHALTHDVQVGLGTAALLLNAAVYWRIVTRHRRAPAAGWASRGG